MPLSNVRWSKTANPFDMFEPQYPRLVTPKKVVMFNEKTQVYKDLESIFS